MEYQLWKKELGLTVSENELELIYSGREDKKHVFFDIYYLKKDFPIEDLTIQKEEVEFVEWCTVSKINQLINNGLFLESHSEELNRMIDISKKRGVCFE